MPKILVLDTCGPTASFALSDTTSRAGRTVELEGRSASERLLPELRSSLAVLGWALPEITAVAAVSGPGSFTGARIGLAAAKGLCEALGLPLILTSRLAVLAHKAAPDRTETVHALLNAGRGELFYRRSGPAGPPLEALLSRDAVLFAATQGLVVACQPDVPLLLPTLSIHLTPPLTAADAIPLALQRLEQGEFDDVAVSDANYLRRTETEVLERLRLHARSA